MHRQNLFLFTQNQVIKVVKYAYRRTNIGPSGKSKPCEYDRRFLVREGIRRNMSGLTRIREMRETRALSPKT